MDMFLLCKTIEYPAVHAVYKITCLANNKCYIGSAKNYNARMKEHYLHLYKKVHCNKYFQNCWNKHKNKFITEILEIVNTLEELIPTEQKYLDIYYDNQKRCMNICPTAGSVLGKKVTEETKQKISKGNKGKKRTPEMKERQSELSKARIETHFKAGEDNPMYGIKSEHAIEVAQIDSNSGKILHIFESMKDAAVAMCGNKHKYSNVSAVIRGTKKTAFGFIWKEKTSEIYNMFIENVPLPKEELDKHKKKRKVISPEERAKLSEARRKVPFLGFTKNHTEESKRKVSMSKMPSGKKIKATNINTNEIEYFECQYDISIKYPHLTEFRAVIRGKRNSIFGFKFEYVNI